ncbi:hypothetical protein NH340_JMT08104 [Sarcoptes scabiei]|nr:hypothetical protein NH340_JMT08104 [Sarcoptes scabiei]
MNPINRRLLKWLEKKKFDWFDLTCSMIFIPNSFTIPNTVNVFEKKSIEVNSIQSICCRAVIRFQSPNILNVTNHNESIKWRKSDIISERAKNPLIKYCKFFFQLISINKHFELISYS